MRENFRIGEKLSEHLRTRDEQGDMIGFNEDLVSGILAKGDQGELKDLLIFWQENGWQITDKEIEIFSYYQKLRQQVHKDREGAFKKRKTDALEKTEEELLLGCYLEELEPQVRQAVLGLNVKGYKTQGSGFGPENIQKIYCADEQFAAVKFSNDLLSELKVQSVDLEVKPKSITLCLNKKLSLNEVRNIWKKIEEQVKPKSKLLT